MKAYPFIHKHPTTGNTKLEEGMDLRDYFAGIAMLGFMSQPNGCNDKDQTIAWMAYGVADEMMKQREVKNDQP
jgi:hypothetical protein